MTDCPIDPLAKAPGLQDTFSALILRTFDGVALWAPDPWRVAYANPATCFMHGQAYLAGTSIGRDLTENERVKIVCVHQVAVETGRSVAETKKPTQPQP